MATNNAQISMIGAKFTLWIVKYSNNAYKDQMDKEHNGYVIKSEYIVKVTDIRNDVADMWTGKFDCIGWKAVDVSNGKEFSCNWDVFPSDSSSPTYYWDVIYINGEHMQPVDAVQAYNRAYNVYVYEDNRSQRARPIGEHIDFCSKHSICTYTWQGKYRLNGMCWRCNVEAKRNV